MFNKIQRYISVMLSVILVFALICGVNVQVNAATVDYVKSGKYIYNWGIRGEVATFLSPNAEKFYSDNNTSYASLAALLGSSNISSVPSSTLYKELKSLMESNHTHKTSYGETRYLYQYTDCQNSAKTGNKISSFYSGDEIGPGWDYGETWNREHTWPKSKTNYKKVENSDVNEATDIMSLRPTAASENTSRSNKAYGTNTNGTYFNPNNFANGKYDLRGDCARIMLYVYVRWGNTSKMWGGSGVIESKDILLKWVKEDPVDTWELGRNDSVESITGTRNVFVDYPELAFHLFGAQTPSDYQTPSNNIQGGTTPLPPPTTSTPQDDTQNNVQSESQPSIQPDNQSNTQSPIVNNTTTCAHKGAQVVASEDPRCDLEGYTAGEYCNDCNQYISGRDIIKPTGHTYAGDCDVSCDTCGVLREISSEAVHTFGDDNICTACGTKNTEGTTSEKQDTTDTNLTTDESISDKVISEKNESEKSNFAWIIIVASVVLVAGGVTLIIIFREKIWPKEI